MPDASLGDEIACTSCDVTGGSWTFALDRGHYRVLSGLRELRTLFPSAPDDPDDGPFDNVQLASLQGTFGISGRVLDTRTGCTRFELRSGARFCTQLTTVTDYRALASLSLSSGTLLNQASVAPASTVAPRASGTLALPHSAPTLRFTRVQPAFPPAVL
jgi:hypothetical protein